MYSYFDCSNFGSWATINDLYDRYGEEFVDKLSVRRVWDDETGHYLADESKESMTRVQCLALDDARALLQEKISSKFKDIARLDREEFFSLKQWHIKLTIETLKKGGDCRGCECIADIDKFLEGKLCSDKGCLPRIGTFISVYSDELKCERGKECK